MTIMEMFGQSGVLALLGMSVVFSFLVIMIISITFTGKIIQALGLGKALETPAQTGSASGTDNNPVTAAISAAVNEYRKKN